MLLIKYDSIIIWTVVSAIYDWNDLVKLRFLIVHWNPLLFLKHYFVVVKIYASSKLNYWRCTAWCIAHVHTFINVSQLFLIALLISWRLLIGKSHFSFNFFCCLAHAQLWLRGNCNIQSNGILTVHDTFGISINIDYYNVY